MVEHESAIRYEAFPCRGANRLELDTRTSHTAGQGYQAAISVRWKIGSPWNWKRKHLAWYLAQFAEQHANSTTYYCLLTINLLCLRLGKSWKLNQANKIRPRGRPRPLAVWKSSDLWRKITRCRFQTTDGLLRIVWLPPKLHMESRVHAASIDLHR